MAKKLKAVVTLQIEAGKASPAPPIGPALAGMVAESTGTFTGSYLASAVVTGFAMVFAWYLPKP